MDDLISRQDAIDAAERESTRFGAYGYMDTKSIIDMLNNLPSAQREFAKDTNVPINDYISRQAAIDVADRADYTGLAVEDVKKVTDEVVKELKKLPSVQNVPDRNVGEWDMFELITSVWYGKQCYFVEENGIVYSRVSCKHMSVDEAIKEFLGRIGDDGRI